MEQRIQDTPMGPGDEWINLDSGTLHRGECHVALHFLQNRTKIHYRVGEILEPRWLTPAESLARDYRSRIAPIGVGFGYTKKCGVCKPVGEVEHAG